MNSHHNSVSKRRLFSFVFVLALIISLLSYFAPKYLAYADTPVKSDLVVLFVGPDFKAREKEAKRLIEEGYAEYLLVPTVGSFWENSSALGARGGIRGKLSKFAKAVTENSQVDRGTQSSNGKPFFERTHLEILDAKRAMEEHGLRSALFVSSPWHMRRIKIITESVFNGDGKYKITYVPTRFEKLPASLPGLCKYAYRSIIQEYMKITAFLAYSYAGA